MTTACINENVTTDATTLEQPVIPKLIPEDMPGGLAVWVLIFAELTEFALFFIIFLVAKAFNPEIFAQGPGQLHTLAGALNTIVLLTSSFFVARAIHSIKRNKLKYAQRWLWLTLLAGSCYVVIKLVEYQANEALGISSNSNLFFTIYYYLTFNHLLHVLMGMCTIGWVLMRSYFGAYDEQNHEGLEAAACYWHMVDLVWIIIFPLLYVLR
jgi:cytochrome c oxidase subunit 3